MTAAAAERGQPAATDLHGADAGPRGTATEGQPNTIGTSMHQTVEGGLKSNKTHIPRKQKQKITNLLHKQCSILCV